jgi:DNA-binding transcriptional MerR regulator
MTRQRSQDNKTSQPQFFRIGEVAEKVGVKPYVLRYWESEFKWLAPEKSRMKQRVYSRADLNLVELIARLLHEERYTIEGARKVIGELKGDWNSGLTALNDGNIAAPATAAPNADVEKELLTRQKELDKRTKALRDLKAAHSDLTRELVHERQRVARLLEEMQQLQTQCDGFEEELQTRPKGDPVFFNLLKTELEELASLADADHKPGPALQPAD